MNFKLTCILYRCNRFTHDWIYPAYCLCNLLFNRYDLVKTKVCKPYQYSDSVERMLFACMQLVVDFVDNEDPFHVVDWTWCPEQIQYKKDIIEIYEYWTEIRPQMVFEAESCNITDGYYKFCELDEIMHELDNYYLQKCINVREVLWT